eukprot:TRINITY_DN6184_c1_g1_i1.p1 TRINITY_DN6184_c1_g1~~TRINITY_DN6184_c1_g1_i1.p1  ORF type:complete len:648 (-),score=108.25 TRINITY_DN6184_c1_g1_i1:156-2099(-)
MRGGWRSGVTSFCFSTNYRPVKYTLPFGYCAATATSAACCDVSAINCYVFTTNTTLRTIRRLSTPYRIAYYCTTGNYTTTPMEATTTPPSEVNPRWLQKPTSTIQETPEGFTTLTEGKATVIFSKKDEGAFYNEAQEANRDLSLLIIQQVINQLMEQRGAAFDGVTIFEGLSASGLRAIRYWKELYGVKRVIANDLEDIAVGVIKRNVEHNGLSTEEVVPNQGDASLVMYNNKEKYDIIDLDPYGSVAGFVDAAVQSVASGGLLCVTSTDMQVLCGNYPETCFYKYGGFPLRGKVTHEHAVRLVLATLERSASRYKRYIVPVACLMIDFYVRLYVRVYSSAEVAKASCTKLSTVYECTGCSTHFFQPLGVKTTGRGGQGAKFSASTGPPVSPQCPECNRPFKVAGPIWNKELCDTEFVKKALEHLDKNKDSYRTFKKINGHLSLVSQELQDVPLFYDLSSMCKLLHVQQPSMREFHAGLESLAKGYRHSVSHTDAKAIKTDAPASVLWDLLRSWNNLHPVKRIAPNSAAEVILTKPLSSVVPDFTPGQKIVKEAGKPRFYLNPPNWGPGKRGTFNINKRKTPEPDADQQQPQQQQHSATAEESDKHKPQQEEEEEQAAKEGEGAAAAERGVQPPETKRSRTEQSAAS